MKREDKNKQSKPEQKPARENMFKESDVQELITLNTLGVMGLGGEECAKRAQKLPEKLQKMLIASIMASRETVAMTLLGSLAAKAAAKKK